MADSRVVPAFQAGGGTAHHGLSQKCSARGGMKSNMSIVAGMVLSAGLCLGLVFHTAVQGESGPVLPGSEAALVTSDCLPEHGVAIKSVFLNCVFHKFESLRQRAPNLRKSERMRDLNPYRFVG